MRWHDMTPETALLTIAAVQLVLLGGFVALGLVVRNALLGLREAADRMALEARCVPPGLFTAADGGPLPGAGPMRPEGGKDVLARGTGRYLVRQEDGTWAVEAGAPTVRSPFAHTGNAGTYERGPQTGWALMPGGGTPSPPCDCACPSTGRP